MKRLLLLGLSSLYLNTAFSADITVSAAASLKEAFEVMAADYEKQYPQDKIKLNTAASGVLLRQIESGAPVDVFASADEATMNVAAQKNLLQNNTRKTFARNHLVLITPKKSSVRIQQLADLQQADVKRIALGKPQSVPAGAYSKSALEKAGLFNTLNAKYVYTQNVRQALDYVVRGEVEAGFVYQTDAQLKQFAVHIVRQVPTPTPVTYPIAMLSGSQHKTEAQRFIQYVLSPEGQRVLARYGFAKP